MNKRPLYLVRAFTLVELLVVMSIITVLIAMFLPTLHRSREQANVVTCQNNMRQILLGFGGYLQNNNDHYPLSAANPSPEDWIYWQASRDPNQSRISPYMGNVFNPKTFRCPSDDESTHLGNPGDPYRYSYTVNINVCGYWPDRSRPHEFDQLGMAQIRHAADCILLVEETEQTIDDGCWAWQAQYGGGMNVMSVRHNHDNRELANNPSNPTAGSSNAGYCDGHVAWTSRSDSFNVLHWDPTR